MAFNPKNKQREIEIIGISGKQYAGKDVLTRLIIAKYPEFKQIPLAQAIKQQYANQHGLTLEEIEAYKAEHRPGLIDLGDWGRAQDPDYWLKQVLEQPGKKIISDVRLRREYDLLRQHGAFLIRLEASREIRSQRGVLVSENDLTECDLDTVTDWDAVLYNNGEVSELKTQVNALSF
jgi:phosphomevalonate kinase